MIAVSFYLKILYKRIKPILTMIFLNGKTVALKLGFVYLKTLTFKSISLNNFLRTNKLNTTMYTKKKYNLTTYCFVGHEICIFLTVRSMVMMLAKYFLI